MASSSATYQTHHTQFHLLLAATLLAVGGVGVFSLWSYWKILQSGGGEIALKGANFGLAVTLLFAPIPLVLELIQRKTGWLISKKAGIALLVIGALLVVAAHEGSKTWYRPYLKERGWEKCGEYVSRGKSSQLTEYWRPQGECGADN